MKIVVTGSSGFIGRHLIPKLIKNGHEVIAVVRDKNKITNFDIDCLFVECDLGNVKNDVYAKLGKPDVLVHLAWGGLLNYKSLHHIDVELPTHFNFIKLMVQSGLKHVAVAGTCFEYGMQSGELYEELETKPNNPYGYAKDALRKQLQFLQNENYFNLIWMRLFYIYGEDQPDNTLYSQLHLAARSGQAVFNMSGGEQLRDYLHVDEVTKMVAELVCKKKDVGIVNVCNGTPISVRNLVEKWIDEKGWNVSLNLGYYSYPDYEPLAFWGNSDKFSQIIQLGV